MVTEQWNNNNDGVLNPNVHKWMNENTRAANNERRLRAQAAAAAVAEIAVADLIEPAPANNDNDDSNDDGGNHVINAGLLALLEVFPDMSIDFALELLQQENNDIEKVLERITTDNDEYRYPRDRASSSSLEELETTTSTSEATTDNTTTAHEDNSVEEQEEVVREQQEQKQSVPAAGGGVVRPDTTYNYDFMSPASFKPSHRYQLQSLGQLLFRFPFLENRFLSSIFQSSSCHYAIAHDNICQSILEKVGTPIELETACEGGGKKFDEMLLCVLDDIYDDKKTFQKNEVELLVECLKKKKVKHNNDGNNEKTQKKRLKINKQQLTFSLSQRFVIMMRGRSRKNKIPPRVTCPILMEELRYVKEKTMELKATLEAGIAKRNQREKAIQDGTAVVCCCCYDEYSFEEMVACREEGHLFCQDCLCSYVETQVFERGSLGFTKDNNRKEIATEKQCCAGDCSSGFDQWALRKALKEKVLQKYDELQYQTTIEKAGLSENMCGCPRCELMFEVPEEANFFVCPIEGCDYEACRHCGEPPHVEKSCVEVEKEGEAKGRQRVEEAATAAIVRKCPSCKKGIMKEDGCNKMTCPCRQNFCYCCGKKINSYAHFCQVPHCDHSDSRKCENKCPLWTNSFDLEIQDRELARGAAMDEAAKVEAENAAKMETENEWNPSNKGKSLGRRRRGPKSRGVDVESILAVPGRF